MGGWLCDVKTMTQDRNGDIWGYDCVSPYLDGRDFWSSKSGEDLVRNSKIEVRDLAVDWDTAIITLEQYEAALAQKEHPLPWDEEKTDADGWIDWPGGECPIDSAAFVDYKMRNGTVDTEDAHLLRWNHLGFSGDIIAYRLHQPQEAEQVRAAAWNAYAGITEADDEADLNDCIGQTPAPVWNGEGLPPVGVEFEYGSHRSRAKCLAHGFHYVFASKGNPDDEESDYEEFLIDAGTEYYPVDEDRAAIRKVIKAAGITSSYADKIANALIDAGYRKQ